MRKSGIQHNIVLYAFIQNVIMLSVVVPFQAPWGSGGWGGVGVQDTEQNGTQQNDTQQNGASWFN
jgi:hypothetical protein